MPESKVHWYGRRVLAVIEGATPEALAKLAMQTLALARVNIQANGQIDTGFMLNSGYVVTEAGQQNEPDPSGIWYSKKSKRGVQRNLAPAAKAPKGGAALHFAAEYAAYQEMKNSFLYRALEQVVPEAAGLMQALFREVAV